MAKDMGEALNEIDVIDFDTEEVDEVKMDDDTPAHEAFRETLEQDKVLLGTLRARPKSDDAMLGKGQSQMAGFPYSQGQVEQTLGRWLNYRPGRDVNVSEIRAYLKRSTPGEDTMIYAQCRRCRQQPCCGGPVGRSLLLHPAG